MEKPLRYERKLVKYGGSSCISIPAEWLKKQAKKLGRKILEKLDVLIYKDYIEIRAVTEE